MDAETAKAVLILWESKQFDSAGIARLLGEREADVVRLVQASRDIRREFAAENGEGERA